MSNITEENFMFYEGEEQVFDLNGKKLIIPSRLDSFNYYRTKFRKLAKEYSKQCSQKYIEQISDYDSFVSSFLGIYEEFLDLAIEKAIGVLISAGIYNVSIERFREEHTETSSKAVEYYTAIEESGRLTEENNAQTAQEMFNTSSALRREGALGDFFRGFASGVVEKVSGLDEEQKKEIYGRVILHQLFNRVYYDFWAVYLTLVDILRRNGKDIWCNDSGYTDEIKTILNNLSNPNFPQDKVVDILFDAILKNPYKNDLLQLIEEKYEDTEEVRKILAYFDYPEDEFTYTEEDFPKSEPEQSDESIEEDKNSSDSENEQSSSQNEKKPFSFRDKVDKEKVKTGLKIGAGLLMAGVLSSRNKNEDSDAVRELKRQTNLMKKQNEINERNRRDAERERKHQAAVESQRQWRAVKEANEERRRKGQPELPLPPRTWD